jgi:hypothetical protein
MAGPPVSACRRTSGCSTGGCSAISRRTTSSPWCRRTVFSNVSSGMCTTRNDRQSFVDPDRGAHRSPARSPTAFAAARRDDHGGQEAELRGFDRPTQVGVPVEARRRAVGGVVDHRHRPTGSRQLTDGVDRSAPNWLANVRCCSSSRCWPRANTTWCSVTSSRRCSTSLPASGTERSSPRTTAPIERMRRSTSRPPVDVATMPALHPERDGTWDAPPGRSETSGVGVGMP